MSRSRFSPDQPNDAPISVRKLERGDKDTIARASKIIRGFVRAYIRDPNLVEDVVQNTLVELLGKLARGDRPQTPHYWILTAASNAVRREYTRLRRSPEMFRSQLHPQKASGLSTQHRAGAELRRVRELLAHKPQWQQQALMAIVVGRESKQVAEEFGMSPGALRTAVSRLRHDIREQLRSEAEFGTLAQLARAANRPRTRSDPASSHS
jgi:RNA polymerase sigma factor (sigma-70 family)